jgi:hypothetical protein
MTLHLILNTAHFWLENWPYIPAFLKQGEKNITDVTVFYPRLYSLINGCSPWSNFNYCLGV